MTDRHTDRQTDRHRMTAKAALAYSIARQKFKPNKFIKLKLKRYLVNFKLKILPLVATKLMNFRSFSGNETSNWDDWVAEW